MKTKSLALALATFTTLHLPIPTCLGQGTAFTYQGQLKFNGAPANGNYDFQFIVFNVAQFGFPLGPILTNANVTLNDGLFASTLDFGPGIFTGTNYWLEIGVRTNGGTLFTTLVPRQPLTPTPYALMANSASNLLGQLPSSQLTGTYSSAVTLNNAANNFVGGFSGNGAGMTNVDAATLGGLTSSSLWKLGGNAGANPTNGNFIGTTDNLPLELRVNGARALRFEPTANGIPNVIGGATNNASGAGVSGVFIGSGSANTNQSIGSVIVGGFDNWIETNTHHSLIVGGEVNRIRYGSALSVIAGGFNNLIQSNSPGSVVSGGVGNFIDTNAISSTIGGGTNNLVSPSAHHSAIGGGEDNLANGQYASLAGGLGNTAGANGTVGGGQGNTAGINAVVGGGLGNNASALDSTIGGGEFNSTSGVDATVAGGANNVAAGTFSFAAGQSAKANHQGAFVWADSQSANFASTANDQFLIRAQGGVGIGNNNPQAPLHVSGGGDASLGSGGNFISGLVSGQNLVLDNNEIMSRNNGAASDLVLNAGGGDVGIGRTPTANALEVAGNASKSTAGSWLANSDARIKTDVRTLTNALETLSRVRLVQFRYTDDYRATHPGIEPRAYLNVIAQEFQKVFPDQVRRSGEKLANGDDILQVDTYPLTIYSAAAVQELGQQLKAKEARISALERELSELKQALKMLPTETR